MDRAMTNKKNVNAPIEFGLLSAKEVAEIIGVNAASVLYYARTTSTFPQPIRFNRKIVRWRKADLLSYLNGNALSKGKDTEK